MTNGERARGEGRTLKEAFERYAERRSAILRDERGEMSDVERLDFFEGEENWSAVDISVQVGYHNQWVRKYRVEDR